MVRAISVNGVDWYVPEPQPLRLEAVLSEHKRLTTQHFKWPQLNRLTRLSYCSAKLVISDSRPERKIMQKRTPEVICKSDAENIYSSLKLDMNITVQLISFPQCQSDFRTRWSTIDKELLRRYFRHDINV